MRLMKAVGEMKEGIAVLKIESRIDGKKVSEIKLPENTIIAVIRRKDELSVVRGDTEIKRGDLLYVLTTWENVDEVERRLKG